MSEVMKHNEELEIQIVNVKKESLNEKTRLEQELEKTKEELMNAKYYCLNKVYEIVLRKRVW